MALSNLTKVQTLGIGSNIEVVGVITTGQFKSGTSNLHSTGVELTNLNVSGIATIGGSISIGGTLTYQDVTNIDSVGIITARSNIDCNGDLDVDGHTELDNVNIAGVTTFANTARFSGGDVIFSGTNNFLQWDKSEDYLRFMDGVDATFGNSDDLKIYHSGSDTYITNATNNLRIGNTGSTNLKFFTNNSTRWNIDGSGHFVPDTDSQVDIGTNSVRVRNIYADNLYGSGANLTGISAGAGGDTGLDLNDGVKLRLGTGNDVEFYHASNQNIINYINGNLVIKRATNSISNSIQFDGNGHMYVPDDDTVYFGSSADLTLSHRSSDESSVIKANNSTGFLRILAGVSNSGGILLKNKDDDVTYLRARNEQAVELYYANSKKFETVAGGIKVTGAYALAASSGNNPTIDNADGGNGNNMYFKTGGSLRLVVQSDGHVRPGSDNTFDLGTANDRWRNLYTTDLQLSNEGSTNDVDGTWGNYTIQEGESDLFLINNRNGKKYKFNLTEVS